MTDTEREAKLDEAEKKMTPGVWERRDTLIGADGYHASTEIVGRVQNGFSTPVCKLASGFGWFEGDCEGIVLLRNEIRPLLDRVKELREENERLKAILKEADGK